MTIRQPAERFRALFEPRGIVVAGAATHPGKFGFVAFHNLRAVGYEGALFGTNLTGEDVLGETTYASLDDIPEADLDLVFLGVPASATADVLRQAADRGITAAFCASAGFGEIDDRGRAHQDELAELADSLGILLAGPNGQGVISTPVAMCAQIVAPMPPRGPIAIASQSGGMVSTFGNLARQAGVGISRAVSVGNGAQVGVADFMEWYATDPETTVGLAYLEDIADDTVERLGAVADEMPVVVMRGGRSRSGVDAVAAHTGSRAGRDGTDESLAAAGVTVVDTIGEAYRTAATFATQPLPRGPRTLVFGTAGGWCVITGDAVEASELDLVELPDDLRAEIDARVPPRWSRRNPVDLAGGETRDTIPELLPIIASHPDVDAVIYLGLGIQSNTAAMERGGRYYPDHGLERIVEYHERQDTRFAEAAAAASDRSGKPVIAFTELALTDPDNPGPATVRATGRFCHSAGEEAVAALEHLWHHARRRP
ncbi:MAG: CoA-binding protein [Acidimicrobiales bacterium]